MEKSYLDYKMFLMLRKKNNDYFKNCSLKGTGSFMASLWKPAFGAFVFRNINYIISGYDKTFSIIYIQVSILTELN